MTWTLFCKPGVRAAGGVARMSLGNLYHQLSKRVIWIVHEDNGKWALACVGDYGPKIRRIFDNEDEARAECNRLNAIERGGA